jgi:hypothetical protein
MSATHILHWVPGYLVRGGCDWGDGWWELQSVTDYESGEPQLDPEWVIEGEDRDIDAAEFTGWMSGLIGWPVTVEKSSTRITCLRALKWNREEPVWLVLPAEPEEVTF